MPQITPEIKKALLAAIDSKGSALELSRQTGISHSTFSKYMSGQIRRMNYTNWKVLLPYLKPYLPAQVSISENCSEATVKMIKITDPIKKAIEKAIVKCGSQTELSKLSGLSHQALSKYISGHINRVNDRTWSLLYPFISEFIQDNDKDSSLPNLDGRPMLKSDFTVDSEAVPLNPSRLRGVPILSFAQAAGFEPAVEPLCDYIREVSDRTQLFFDVPDNCFALEVSGDSMEPDYPHGSIALVAAGEFPERGDIVVAKLNTGQVIIKEYHRKDNVITLSSRNPAGKNFVWNLREQPGYVQWMWPVIEVVIKPRNQRHAKMKIGMA